jgi:polyhydroxyalkanoate synthesis regulator phasin
MARDVLRTIHKQVATNVDNPLENLVRDFTKIKPDYDSMSKKIEDLKAKIKTAMADKGVSKVEVDNFVVNLIQSHSYSFDVPKLVEWAKAQGFTITKTVEILDEDVLESLVYNGEITPEQLKPFQKDKVVTKLTCVSHD